MLEFERKFGGLLLSFTCAYDLSLDFLTCSYTMGTTNGAETAYSSASP